MSLNSKFKIPALIIFCAAFAFVSTPLGATPVYSFNTAYSPSSDLWSVPDVGWAFTAPYTATVSGIQTKFSQADSRNVTLELYLGIPNQPGSSLLSSALFAPTGGSFSGSSISPVSLIAGQTYFVGFKGVAGLGVNFTATADPGVVDLPLYYDVSPPPYYTNLQTGYSTGRPILQLDGTAVPEPAALWLTGIGLCGLWFSRRTIRWRESGRR